LQTRNTLTQQLEKYESAYAEENRFVDDFLQLLQSPECYLRTHLPGHITGSAWIVNTNRTHVLLVHHAKLNKWLQPGGHADGDENIMNVALREAEEETGLTTFKTVYDSIFDIDIHPIPSRKDFPQHLHYDVRLLLETDKLYPPVVSEESHDVRWIALQEAAAVSQHNSSIIRMIQKIISK